MEKLRSKSHLIIIAGIVFAVIIGSIQIIKVERNVNAQTCAPIGAFGLTNGAWYQATSTNPTIVYVYIKPDAAWDTAKINAIKAAFNNWENLQS